MLASPYTIALVVLGSKLLDTRVVAISLSSWQSMQNTTHSLSTSHLVYLNQAGNVTHWLMAFQRSLADFLPLLSLPGDIKVGVIDYVIKIVSRALTFGLLLIALRRKFERKYTR